METLEKLRSLKKGIPTVLGALEVLKAGIEKFESFFSKIGKRPSKKDMSDLREEIEKDFEGDSSLKQIEEANISNDSDAVKKLVESDAAFQEALNSLIGDFIAYSDRKGGTIESLLGKVKSFSTDNVNSRLDLVTMAIAAVQNLQASLSESNESLVNEMLNLLATATNAMTEADIQFAQIRKEKSSDKAAEMSNVLAPSISTINDCAKQAKDLSAEISRNTPTKELSTKAKNLKSEIDAINNRANSLLGQTGDMVTQIAGRETDKTVTAADRLLTRIGTRLRNIEGIRDTALEIQTAADVLVLDGNIHAPGHQQNIFSASDAIGDQLVEATQIHADASETVRKTKSTGYTVDLINEMNSFLTQIDGVLAKATTALNGAKKALAKIKAKANRITSFGELAGSIATVPPAIYRKLNWHARNNRTIFGTAMFVGIVVGAICAGFTASQLLNNTAAGWVLPFIWFFLILKLDQILIVSWDKSDAHQKLKNIPPAQGWKEHLQRFFTSGRTYLTLGRILAIVIISYLVSTTVDINIFRKEVTTELIAMKAERLQSVESDRAAKIAKLNADKKTAEVPVAIAGAVYTKATQPYQKVVDGKLKLVTEASDEYLRELNGIESIHHPHGDGPVAKAKLAALNQRKEDYEAAKQQMQEQVTQLPEYKLLVTAQNNYEAEIKRIDALIVGVTKDSNARLAILKKQENNGLADQYLALHRVASQSILPMVVMALFFLFEAIPMIGKMLLGSDEYVDRIVEEHRRADEDMQLRKVVSMQTYADKTIRTTDGLSDKMQEIWDDEFYREQNRVNHVNRMHAMQGN